MALAVSVVGYSATEILNNSTAPARPPSPYAPQEPLDCDPPKNDPVSCGAYDMTCEEKADYYRRLNAAKTGTSYALQCDTFEATRENQ
ncbi:hypothetical protein GCM10020367_53560 [Streptomyces sannanensis]|uniref:Uncharacterized protein n=1 Tax=Streptomyces sannanensis TaxID=285536 RepID=A0ABP6SI72_9ACTN